MQRIYAFLSLSCLVVAAVGCKGSDGRQAISGTVTLKGEPLDDGIIEFSSTGSKTGASISKGKYAIPAESGLAAGKYKVMITAGDGRTPADSPDGLPGPTGANIISKDRIPAKYNVDSTEEVTVSNTSKNVFDYAIP